MSVAIHHLADADIRDRDGVRWWHCPCCRRTLAEVVGNRIVVKRGSLHWSAPVIPGMTQTCPHCGTASVYPFSC